MGGIAVLFHPDGRPVDAFLVGRMIGALRHRGLGPDAAWPAVNCLLAGGAVCGGSVRGEAFGDSRGEDSNRGDGSARFVIAADARIDNREELQASLGIGREGERVPDDELILRAYERWGEEAPAKLIGDFAFIIHDSATGRIFCARDHIGIRPFYYHHRDGFFAAASEIKGLLAHPEIPSAPDEQRIGDYLTALFDDKEITFYAAIRRLPPGHLMIVDREGIRLRPYASLDTGRELRLGSDAEYADAFGELFTEAVRCRLAGATPIGAALSGGLDSSSVAAVAARLLAKEGRGPLLTFSAVYSRPEADERRYMEAVVASGGMHPHYIAADDLDPLAGIDAMIARLDEPFFSPNFYIHWRLLQGAAASGAGVWLDGLDGDTVVSHGIGYLAELARSGRWSALKGEIGALADRGGSSPARLLRRGVVNPLVLAPLRRAWHGMNGRLRRPWGDRSIVREDFAGRIGLAGRFNNAIGELPAARTLRQEHHRRIEWGLHPFILEMLDKGAATFNIEPRYPFYDRRLIEFCLALPPEQKLHDGWSRAVLRRAMEGILPPDVRLRTTKGDPGASFFIALRRHNGAFMRDIFSGDAGGLGEYVDLPKLRNIYERFMQQHATGEEIMELWKGVTLGVWMKGGDFRF